MSFGFNFELSNDYDGYSSQRLYELSIFQWGRSCNKTQSFTLIAGR